MLMYTSVVCSTSDVAPRMEVAAVYIRYKTTGETNFNDCSYFTGMDKHISCESHVARPNSSTYARLHVHVHM